jgi:carbamoyl-phosphate synthase small subunit
LLKLRTQNGGYLLLEDGAKFSGDSFFGNSSALGEAVFNTSHTGYQEIISDPSYYRQLITFTAPHVGNVGVNRDDSESSDRRAAGVIIKSLPLRPQNWRAEDGLAEWLECENLPMLVGANTRGITLHLRDRGAMRAGLFPNDIDPDEAIKQVIASESMEGADLAEEVTTTTPYEFNAACLKNVWHQPHNHGQGLRVAVLDFGVKINILRELSCRGCQVIVLPATTNAEQIVSDKYDGLLISNGPGDPASVTYGIETVRKLLPTGLPLFGICLGHQLLSLAAGGSTFKLPFGHRGANHPVRREDNKTIEITSQNHGFAVTPNGLPSDWHITHVNLNDHTVEGLRHISLPVFSIQYHPEASPGPHEGHSYFDQFIKEMHRAQA